MSAKSVMWARPAGSIRRRAGGVDEVGRHSSGEFSLVQGGHSFCSFRPSNERVRPTHIMESNLLYPKFTDLNVELIQKLPPH